MSGSMQGAEKAKNNREAGRRKADAEMKNLRSKIGDDAFRGLEALASCKHIVAIAYAEAAQADENYDYALAGLWLEVMSVAETGGDGAAEAMLPELVEQDKKMSSTNQAKILLAEVISDLEDVRENSGTDRKCAA